MHKELAKITGTFLGVEDHGIFTAMLHVDYESGSSQSIGGYSFDEYNKELESRRATAYGAEFIRRILEVVGVETWEKIPGKIIYVLRENDGWGAKNLGIESVTFRGKRKTFLFDDLYKELYGEPNEVSGPV